MDEINVLQYVTMSLMKANEYFSFVRSELLSYTWNSYLSRVSAGAIGLSSGNAWERLHNSHFSEVT